jgi:hypothetical protein
LQSVSKTTLKSLVFLSLEIPLRSIVSKGVFYQSTLGVVVIEPYSIDFLSKHKGPNAATPNEEKVSGY